MLHLIKVFVDFMLNNKNCKTNAGMNLFQTFVFTQINIIFNFQPFTESET